MPTAPENTFDWLSCPDCEAPCRNRALPAGTELRCMRCGGRLKTSISGHSLQVAWAFATAGLFLVLLANFEPILTFDVVGNTQSNRIFTGVFELIGQGFWPVALLAGFAGMFAPAMHLGAIWYVTAACCLGLRWPHLRRAFRLVEILEPWNLVPVYAIATVVAVVKLKMLGTVAWQQGALWVIALSLCSLFAAQAFNPELVEEKLEVLE